MLFAEFELLFGAVFIGLLFVAVSRLFGKGLAGVFVTLGGTIA